MRETSFACGFISIERRTIFDLWQMSYAALRNKDLHYYCVSSLNRFEICADCGNTTLLLSIKIVDKSSMESITKVI